MSKVDVPKWSLVHLARWLLLHRSPGPCHQCKPVVLGLCEMPCSQPRWVPGDLLGEMYTAQPWWRQGRLLLEAL